MVRESDKAFDLLCDDVKYIRGALDKIHGRITAHERECPARGWYGKRKDKDSSDSIVAPKFSLTTMLFRFGPVILAAALGLLGLGAYWGNNQASAKLQKEIEQIQKTLNKGMTE